LSTTETLGTIQEANKKPVLLYCDTTTLLCEFNDSNVLKSAGVKGSFTFTWKLQDKIKTTSFSQTYEVLELTPPALQNTLPA